jgi:hypothetical protein
MEKKRESRMVAQTEDEIAVKMGNRYWMLLVAYPSKFSQST